VFSDLMRGIRKIIIASELSGNNIDCITGMQGVGKTTLLKNLYALGEDQLNITIGRGEKLK
jgi:ABC-type cobalamin/Fe3+-siderophores transport system ATPase subunit